jgi:alkylation response protein AidB-like acyl-CoA dehydrogenase
MKYLVPLAKGEVIGAFCLSEPEAGSDATSQNNCIDKGDHYLLNGTKTGLQWNTASTYLVIAQTDVEKGQELMLLLLKKRLGWF